MKKRLFVPMILLAVMLLSACSGIPDSQVDISAVQERLDKIDAYKASLPDTQASLTQDYSQTDTSFRGFSFGTSMQIIGAMETLTLSEQFSDALDYTGSGLYSYDMLLTYWFNSAGQFYSASYSMQDDAFFETIDALMSNLRGDYGEPTESGYYDSTNTAVVFDTEEKALDAVDNDGAYFYASFVDQNGILIELYVAKKDAGYDFWVYYTDYSYYN